LDTVLLGGNHAGWVFYRQIDICLCHTLVSMAAIVNTWRVWYLVQGVSCFILAVCTVT